MRHRPFKFISDFKDICRCMIMVADGMKTSYVDMTSNEKDRNRSYVSRYIGDARSLPVVPESRPELAPSRACNRLAQGT